MRKTRETSQGGKVTVDLINLQDMLCVGRNTAEEIGKNANAIIKIGRRKLYNVEKIKTYLNELSEG